jgi:hypothetical protein
MKAFTILAAVTSASATYYPVENNDGYYKPIQPVYPVYPVKPIQPVYPVYPVKPIHPIAPVQPIAPIVPTVTVVVSETPAPIVKLPTTMSCKKWNRIVNEEECEFVAKTKCTTKPSKKSKFDECSEETCCLEEPEEAPVAENTTTTATIISCAQFAGQPENKLQCQVAVEGACAVEGPFGQYNQCSKDLCCRAAAPVLPAPQIVGCDQVVKGNGWSCGFVPNYACSLTGPSGNYPACTFDVCCLAPVPPTPVNPCDYCDTYWCPPSCSDYKPVDPCANCDLPYAYCPTFCTSPNTGSQRYY